MPSAHSLSVAVQSKTNKMYKKSTYTTNLQETESKKILSRQFQTGTRTTETDTNKKHIPNAKRQKQNAVSHIF